MRYSNAGPVQAEWTRLEHTPIVIDDPDDETYIDDDGRGASGHHRTSSNIPLRMTMPTAPSQIQPRRHPSVISINSDQSYSDSDELYLNRPFSAETMDNYHYVDDNDASHLLTNPMNEDDEAAEGDVPIEDHEVGIDELRSSTQSTPTLSEYEPPKSQQPRRLKSVARKQVKLVRGNLVLDCPVPTKLYSFLPRRDHDEFVYMRYTACTSDPDTFGESGFTLRPAIYGRETQLCVCITMYNEDEVAFTRTLHAVMKNIAHLCSRNKSRMWGKEGWKKVVVSVVADGRTKVHKRVLDALAAIGVYQDGIAKNFVNGREVQAHIFEYTTQVSVDKEMKFQGAEKGIVPVQMLFCLKEKNHKKINSHRWLFNAFCPILDPNVCILLDVGTRPGNTTIYHLWKAFDSDSNVAGACGEIRAMTGKFSKNLLNPLVAAQNFEYKMSNILDKPLESAFGYISVLPGALSAYRYRALQNNPDGTGPLNSYFKGEFLHGAESDIFTSNMYLAEDRILCWELVAKQKERWVLRYVRAATGETDVPDTVPEFISQRRRWLNGSLFAAIYALTHFRQIWKTDHSTIRKFMLHIEFAYQFGQLVFTFFSLANFFLTFYFVSGSLQSVAGIGGEIVFLIFKYLCICVIAAQFVLSLGNRPQGSPMLFTISMACLAVIMAFATACGLYYVIDTLIKAGKVSVGENAFTTIIISLLSTYGLYAITSFLYLDPWHIFTSSLQYFLLLPGYICTLQIFALCNTHDVTWGTKGDNEQKMDLGSAVVRSEAGKDVVEIEMPAEQLDIDSGYDEALHNLREKSVLPPPAPNKEMLFQDYYREIRTRVVLVWMVANMLLAMIMVQVFGNEHPGSNIYLQIILWSVAAMAAFRAIGSVAYLSIQVVKYVSETKYKTARRIRK